MPAFGQENLVSSNISSLKQSISKEKTYNLNTNENQKIYDKESNNKSIKNEIESLLTDHKHVSFKEIQFNMQKRNLKNSNEPKDTKKWVQ